MGANFLDLLLELRLQIYMHVLGNRVLRLRRGNWGPDPEDKITQLNYRDYSDRASELNLPQKIALFRKNSLARYLDRQMKESEAFDISLPFVNRQIASEVLPLILRSNTFSFCNTSELYGFRTALRADQSQDIKSICLNMALHREWHVDYWDQAIAKLVRKFSNNSKTPTLRIFFHMTLLPGDFWCEWAVPCCSYTAGVTDIAISTLAIEFDEVSVCNTLGSQQHQIKETVGRARFLAATYK